MNIPVELPEANLSTNTFRIYPAAVARRFRDEATRMTWRS